MNLPPLQKPASASRIELAEIMMPHHANVLGKVFGTACARAAPGPCFPPLLPENPAVSMAYMPAITSGNNED